MPPSKSVELLGTSFDDLLAFPPSAKREAGYQIDQEQNGWEPDYWKPMEAVGQGVKEIPVHDSEGAFRVVYIAKFADAVYVIHCFQKKTRKTNKADTGLASKRYRDLLQELSK
ncbi:type II toxin-antitoxin system RelE/ParE family toxin [Parapusillimonas sp. SGNA-6]|nr:type II toxin-antitoxin system RelE/ParE family toxin [Parapusillimonas sp. SGNA-6]